MNKKDESRQDICWILLNCTRYSLTLLLGAVLLSDSVGAISHSSRLLVTNRLKGTSTRIKNTCTDSNKLVETGFVCGSDDLSFWSDTKLQSKVVPVIALAQRAQRAYETKWSVDARRAASRRVAISPNHKLLQQNAIWSDKRNTALIAQQPEINSQQSTRAAAQKALEEGLAFFKEGSAESLRQA
ncbi:MAG: hypothetical protein ACREPR_23080, partial [Brasilonema sp.]